MFDKDALKSGGTLKSVPDCYKNQQICDKAIENYPYASEFIPECSKILKIQSCGYISSYNQISS